MSDKTQRRLSAIVSADVVGYSRLMGMDEAGTLAALQAHRAELIDVKIALHGGRIVKTMGDGLLLEFPSVVEATQCMIEVQSGMAARNDGIAPDRCITFRVGVNLGDVIVEGEDIFGDGVNIAARLQAIGEPGGIYLSGESFRQVEGKVSIGFVDLGDQTVKNIKKPIRVYKAILMPGPDQHATTATAKNLAPALSRVLSRARSRSRSLILSSGVLILILAIVALATWQPWQSNHAAPYVLALPDKPSVLVLPFANLSGDGKQDYLSDGITENIIGVLATLDQLFVIDRGTTFSLKGKQITPQTVARELGVRYVLEGSFQREGGRVRVNTQLVDAMATKTVWADMYERDIKSLFLLQGDITRNVVTELQIELTEGQQARVWDETGTITENFDAWKLAAQATVLLRKVTKEAIVKSRKLLLRALELDPNYAGAKILLAYTYMMDLRFEWSTNPRETFATAVRETEAALKLNEDIPDVYTLLSYVRLYQNRFEEAVASAEKGISLGPSNADVHAASADILISVGRWDASIKTMKKAIRLSPHHPAWYSVILGMAYWGKGEHTAAIEALDEALVLDPGITGAHAMLAGLHAVIDDMDAAHRHAAIVQNRDPKFSALDYSFQRRYSKPTHARHVYKSLQKAGL